MLLQFELRSFHSCAAYGQGALSGGRYQLPSRRNRDRSSLETSCGDRKRSNGASWCASLIPLVEVVSCVLDLLVQQLALQCGVAGVADHCRCDNVIGLAIMPIFCEGDRSRLGDVPNIRSSNSSRTNRHGVDARASQCVPKICIVLNVVARPQDGVGTPNSRSAFSTASFDAKCGTS
jgi:hypothetical protein